MWTPIGRGMYVQNIPFVPIRLARPWILRGPKHVFSDRNGTNDHEQPRSVPLVLMLSGWLFKNTPRDNWNGPNGIFFCRMNWC